MKLGLCLSGGGARGAYQVGAMKALEELNILSNIEAFSGTSIGSVNASLIATMPIEKLKDIWFSISPDMLKRTEGIFKKIIEEKMEFKQVGLFDIHELENLLKLHLDVQKLKQKEVYVTLSEGGASLEGIFGLIKSSYQHYVKKEKKVIYANTKDSIDDLSIYKQIIASCSIPIAFAPTRSESHQFYDGGVYDNVPVTPLVENGCDHVIIVHLHRIHTFDPKKFPDVVFDEIKPKHNLGSLLKFDGERSKDLFERGYLDTLEYFKAKNKE
ncbi:MAG: patatin-like phospholipase family protein [Candidatus Izemoplasmatales bacterium]